MLDLVAALKTAGTLKSFIEDGGLEEAIGDVGLASAHVAVRKARRAEDPRSQMWSAVNHLEEAEESFFRVTKRRNLLWFNYPKYLHSLDRLIYVRFLMAACYRYLGETELAAVSLGRARSVRDESEDGHHFLIHHYGRLPASFAYDVKSRWTRGPRPIGMDPRELSELLYAMPVN